jgi:hypothetical protein
VTAELIHNVQVVDESSIAVQLAIAVGGDARAIGLTAIQPVNESVLHDVETRKVS